jgi:hypothetical protein
MGNTALQAEIHPTEIPRFAMENKAAIVIDV